jgi:His/Glu/Gln/Arg/opine family amino acid ABC transporter permease subunit
MGLGDYLSILEGAGVTIAVSLIAIAIGAPLGLGLALIRWRRVPVLDPIVATVVSFLRAVPAVTLALLIFFALPGLGLSLPRFGAAVTTLALGTTAFNCEIWRATLLSFPRDQFDAALASGMTGWQRFRLIVLPQIVRAALPGLVNEATLLVKVSPAVAVIGVVEATRAAVRVGAETYEPLPPFLVALVIYVVLIAGFVLLQRGLERRQKELWSA